MRTWQVLLAAAAALLFYAGGVKLSVDLEEQSPGGTRGGAKDLIYLPSPKQAKLMSLGFNTVVADYYWVKALQYFTDPTQMLNQYKNLGDYLDVVLGVDPDYEYAYKFAGIAIPYDSGRFHFVNTRRSTEFLERGVARFPNNWQLHFYLGFNYLNFHSEPIKAAEQFEAASKLPESPMYLRAFAARLYTIGGQLDQAIEFARTAAENAQDPETRAMMQQRLLDLQVERELRRIEAAAKDFKEKNGRFPKDLAELVATGFQAPPPQFSLDAEGVAHTTLTTDRMILHWNSDAPRITGE